MPVRATNLGSNEIVEEEPGSQRIYPDNPLLCEDIVYRQAVLDAMNEFKRKGAWRGTDEERFVKFDDLLTRLSNVFGIPKPRLTYSNMTRGFSGSSYYSPSSHEIHLSGKWSVITFLHEFIHSCGFGETNAVRWSTNLFKKVFPEKAANLNPHTHCLVPRVDVATQINPEARQSVESFGNVSLVIGAPHDVTAGSGLKGDLHTGKIARELARTLNCKLVVMTDYRASGINVSYPVYRDSFGRLQNSVLGQQVYDKYIAEVGSLPLVEIHGIQYEDSSIEISSNGITTGDAGVLKEAFGSVSGVSLKVEPLDRIQYADNLSKLYGSMKDRKALHIELSKDLRANFDKIKVNLLDLLVKFVWLSGHAESLSASPRTKVRAYRRTVR